MLAAESQRAEMLPVCHRRLRRLHAHLFAHHAPLHVPQQSGSIPAAAAGVHDPELARLGFRPVVSPAVTNALAELDANGWPACGGPVASPAAMHFSRP